MNDMLIRRMEAKDATGICKIYRAITKEPDRSNVGKIIREHVANREDACFVAEIDGKIVGYMISYILPGSFGTQESAWITMLGVSPDYMGRGIGKTLGKTIFEHYRKIGIKNIYTSARWFDGDLLSFFSTLGFHRSEYVNLEKKID